MLWPHKSESGALLHLRKSMEHAPSSLRNRLYLRSVIISWRRLGAQKGLGFPKIRGSGDVRIIGDAEVEKEQSETPREA